MRRRSARESFDEGEALVPARDALVYEDVGVYEDIGVHEGEPEVADEDDESATDHGDAYEDVRGAEIGEAPELAYEVAYEDDELGDEGDSYEDADDEHGDGFAYDAADDAEPAEHDEDAEAWEEP